MMKNVRYNISLYIIVPAIFSGISTLCIIAAYRLTRYYLDRDTAPEWPLAYWSFLLVLLTFVCGLLVIKFIVDPMRSFVGKTKKLGLVSNIPLSRELPSTGSDMQQISVVFDQVTELLSKVEARELFSNIIGQSRLMLSLFNQIMKVAPSDANVLILGETGTGKELIARSIHGKSKRQGNPFIAINCAAIPQGLLESELFGYEKGAFTGATSRKPGKFEMAKAGSIFLDEIGDMPLETQAKVLRVIEEHQIERVGGVKPQKIDVRFIAATNKDLPLMVQQGVFRQDLYYRLKVFTIHVPSLRNRLEDIPLLVEHFLKEYDDPPKQLSTSAMQMLLAYDWPGNVRELQHAIESAAVMADGIQIETAHLPSAVTRGWRAQSEKLHGSPGGSSIDQRLREIEKSMIIEALSHAQGIQNQAAKILGIKERSLWHRLKKYSIDASAYKIR